MATATMSSNKDLDISEIQSIIIKGENEANVILIKMPKQYENIDLTTKRIVLKVLNPVGEYYEEILSKRVEEDNLIAIWEVKNAITSRAGELKITISIEDGQGFVLNSRQASINVLQSTNTTESFTTIETLDQYLAEIRNQASKAKDSETKATEAKNELQSSIVDNLIDGGTKKILSAEQGKVLNTRIDNIVAQTGTSNTEIVDARHDSETNLVYPTLKARLDATSGSIAKSKYSAPATATAPIISLQSTAVKGKMEGSLKGNTLYQAIVGGENQPTGTTKSFIALNGVKYFLLPSKTIITGTAVSVNVTNSTGVNANIMAVQLTTPYENLTVDQLNNLINGYWQGLGNSKPAKAKVIGKNLWNGEFLPNTTISSNPGAEGDFGTNLNSRTTKKIKCKPNTIYRVFGGNRQGWRFEDKNGNKITFPINSAISVTSPANAYYMYVYYSLDGTHENVMLSEGSTALPYEPYQETELFCPVELGSVPNGVSDEFTFDGKFIQRTKEYTLQSGDITSLITTPLAIDLVIVPVSKLLGTLPFIEGVGNLIINGYAEIANTTSATLTSSDAGKFMTSLFTQNLFFIVAKGTYANLAAAQTALAGTKIRYQLATPVETQYPASNLIAEPSGTIYVDSMVKVVKPYKTNITLDVKIKNLTSVTKVDGENRVPILLSLVNVAADGMSLTILNASSGSLYELEYETFGTTLPTIQYSYPLNLNAQVQGNTEALKAIDKNLQDFINYQKVANLQLDLRIALLEGGH